MPTGAGTENLQPLGLAGQAVHLTLVSSPDTAGEAPTSVSLFDQGLVQVLEASVTGLKPKQSYVLALAEKRDGTGILQPLSSFMTNPAGAAIVNAIGPIRQLVQTNEASKRQYLVIVSGSVDKPGALVQTEEVQ